MKRIISLVLVLLLGLTMFAQLGVYAEDDQGLEKAIKASKEKFIISEKLTEFRYDIRIEGERKIYELHWSSKDGVDESINVSIDEKGKIIRYHNYKPYERQGSLPKVNRQEAKNKAEEFIKIIEPDIIDNLKYTDNANRIMETSYNFNYIRVENGIPFYSNNVSVEINSDTGEVRSYFANWSDDLQFPSAENILSSEEAKKAYEQKLGLRLTYNTSVEDEKMSTYLAYASLDNSKFIDAKTGEVIDLDASNYGLQYSEAMYDRKMMSAGKGGDISLSPEEIKAIDEVSKLMTKEDAEDKARKIKIPNLSEKYKLNNSNLHRDWSNREMFVWNLNFVENPGEKHIGVSINAKTGEVISFYTSEYSRPDDEAKFDEASAKTAVENFLKEFYPEKFKDMEFSSNRNNMRPVLTRVKVPANFDFTYIRKVNGIAFPGNTIDVGFNAVTGNINRFNMRWYDLNFASAENVLTIDKVHQIMFNQIGYELQYRTKLSPEVILKYGPIMGDTSIKQEIRLVYAPKPEKPLLIDANNGMILGHNGKPYKEVKTVEYTDIEGNAAEKEITALAELGLTLEGSEFKPETNIIQSEFLLLLSKSIGFYNPFDIESKDKQIEQMYKNLIREGIVKESEKNTNANVTKEDAVKFIIRALKYDKVADLGGIFKCDYKDADKITEGMIGYIVIARGLNIVSDKEENFNPSENLTRSKSAVLLYNYLQVKR